MSVIVKMMSGEQYSLLIFAGYRVNNLRIDLEEKINLGDSQRLFFFINNKEVKDEELIEENSVFNVFIKDPPTIYFEYNNIKEKLDVYIDCVPIDFENYRFLNYYGEYNGVFVPDKPLIVRVHSSMYSMNHKGYREIINHFHQQWMDEFDNNFQKKTWNEDFRETFVSYYKSLLKNKKDNYEHEYEDNDSDREFKEKDIDTLLEIDPYYHLYAFITYHIPRQKNIYDSTLKPVEFLVVDYI